jgi:hypothetical protein
MKSINPVHIKQQLSTMNPETRVIIVHTTSYVRFSCSIDVSFRVPCRTLASIIVKQASNMSLTGAEYMWIMSSVVLCKLSPSTDDTPMELDEMCVCDVPATYSSGSEPKMNPYDNPNRRKMDFLAGTLGQSVDTVRLCDESFVCLFARFVSALYNDVTRGRSCLVVRRRVHDVSRLFADTVLASFDKYIGPILVHSFSKIIHLTTMTNWNVNGTGPRRVSSRDPFVCARLFANDRSIDQVSLKHLYPELYR